ncbi:MAG: preQ(1) synthase [Syntrophobacterales bacterium]|nr:preQ(1) synthase [Syntrophobacterales bacterium]
MERYRRTITQLGRPTVLPSSPEEAVLETFSNPYPGRHYVVRLTAPEFTSLCPITNQPDFALIVVDYVPDLWLVESKSFKLFIASFRNYGTFQEQGTVYIHDRLKEALVPKYLRVIGVWNARGGIGIDVCIQSGDLPSDCQLLPLPFSNKTFNCLP